MDFEKARGIVECEIGKHIAVSSVCTDEIKAGHLEVAEALTAVLQMAKGMGHTP